MREKFKLQLPHIEYAFKENVHKLCFAFITFCIVVEANLTNQASFGKSGNYIYNSF